jgi:hypothetical protein
MSLLSYHFVTNCSKVYVRWCDDYASCGFGREAERSGDVTSHHHNRHINVHIHNVLMCNYYFGLGVVSIFCTSGWEVCVCLWTGVSADKIDNVFIAVTKQYALGYWLAGAVRCCQHALFRHSPRVHSNYTNCFHSDISNLPRIISLFK